MKRLLFTFVMVMIFIIIGMLATKALFFKNDKAPVGGTMVYEVVNDYL